MTGGRVLLAVRVLSGGVFVVVGVGKFVNHASELASSRATAFQCLSGSSSRSV